MIPNTHRRAPSESAGGFFLSPKCLLIGGCPIVVVSVLFSLMLTQQPCAGLTPTVYIWTSLTSLWLKTPVFHINFVCEQLQPLGPWAFSCHHLGFGVESQRPFEDVWASDGLYIISTNVAYDFIWRNFIVRFGFCSLKPNTRFGVWHVFIRKSLKALISLFHVVSSEMFYSSKSDFSLNLCAADWQIWFIHQIAGLDLFTLVQVSQV